MFDFFQVLSHTTPVAAVGAAYIVLTELFKIIPGSSRQKTSQGTYELALSSMPAPQKELSNKLAKKIFKQIQADKKKKLTDLTEKELKKIAQSLMRTVEGITTTEPVYDVQAGKVILESLRKEYPSFPTPTKQ